MRNKLTNTRLAWLGSILGVMAWCAVLAGGSAYAVDPTQLEPAEGIDAGVLKLHLEGQYDKYDKHEAEAETEIEYGFNRHLALSLIVPGEFNEDESSRVGNARLKLNWAINPDTQTGPIVALTAEAAFPTEQDSQGMGGTLRLRLAQPIGASGKHKLHLQLSEEYDNSAEKDERNWLYTALVGYSYQATPTTTLVADFSREQLSLPDHEANMFELGVKQDVGEHLTLALGGGAGVGHESPDWRVRAGVELKFGLK